MPADKSLWTGSLLSALLCIGSDYAGHRRSFYFFKPATLICIIALALALTPSHSVTGDYRFWIIAGLLCSLAGDIALMLPADRFLAGLGAFLLAHWCYIVALAGLPSDPNYFVALRWLALGAILFLVLKLKRPVVAMAVLVYIASILLMGWLAVENWRLSQTGAAAALGAILFIASDTLIGFRRFRAPFPAAQALILGSYFPAQWLLAVSTASM